MRLTHLFCVSTFGLIPAFIPVSNLFILCAFSQATACQSTLFPATYLNRHVGRTNAACFRVLSDFETPCFQIYGFNYSVTSVIGVTFKYPVYFVCCFPCFTAIASVNRLNQCGETQCGETLVPYFSLLVPSAIFVEITCFRTVIFRFVSFQSKNLLSGTADIFYVEERSL